MNKKIGLQIRSLIIAITLIILTLLLTACTLEEINNKIEEVNEINYNPAIQDEVIINSTGLSVASFNIQIFGDSKASNEDVMNYLVTIINNYDVVAVQEVRDKDGDSVLKLMAKLPDYNYLLSDRLGRTTSKEQYLLIYKKGVVEIKDLGVWPDNNDVFEREPHLTYLSNANTSFVLINNHLKPDDVLVEYNYLDEVILYSQSISNDKDFILLGDLNFDCSYADENNKGELQQFTWAIEDHIDTTVGRNDCTYDRVITNMMISDSSVYNFQKKLGVSDNVAKSISDHYPVSIKVNYNG